MKLTILGNSPSFPNPGGACSGYLVGTDSTSLLIDCGHGVVSQLRRFRAPGALAGIVLSHMHPDHFFDLVPLKYVIQFLENDSRPIALWLPPGGIDELDRLQSALGLANDFWRASFIRCEYEPENELTIGNIVIRFAPTAHFISGYAMRFAPEGDSSSSLLYSSDTGPTDAVAELGRGCRLALVEATLTDAQATSEGHLSGSAAGRLAATAGVSRLLLTHYAVENASTVLAEARASYGDAVELAEQGQTYDL